MRRAQNLSAPRYRGIVRQPGQPEIQHHRSIDTVVVTGVDHDVIRFDVAVNHTGAVGRLDRPGHIAEDRCRPPGRHRCRSVAHQFTKRRTLDQPHREIVQPFLVPAIDDRHNAGMIQRPGRDRFAAKPPPLLLAGQHPRGDHLQRHIAAQRQLTCPVDHPHPAAAQHLPQLEIPQPPPR